MAMTLEVPELDEACDLGRRIHLNGEQTLAWARRRRALWLVANRKGLTYGAIADACGVSEAFVTKEIRTARAETRDRKLRARVHRNRHFAAGAAPK
jgi:hypothetical protein